MREITITYTLDVTEVVRDPAEMEFIMRNSVEDLRELTEQSMEGSTNYDDIRVTEFKVFPHED